MLLLHPVEQQGNIIVRKIRLEILGLSSSHSQIGHYALVLGEVKGNRRLPIIIGGAEAQAIALELEGIKTNRPMTHDLLFNMARHFDISLHEIVITDLHEGIFYAKLVLEYQNDLHELDSRPSDAVAIAVRFKANIYVTEEVLEEAGIVIDEDNKDEFTDDEGEFSLASLEREEPEVEEDPAATPAERINRLKIRLEEALDSEDYEQAARLRDEINRLSR